MEAAAKKNSIGQRLKGTKTQRITHEGIDNRRIPAQPIERCPGWLEGLVQDVVCFSRRGSSNLRQSVQRTGTGKDEASDVAAVIDRVELRCERSHTVAQQDKRLSWVLLFCDQGQAKHILRQQAEAAIPKISERLGIGCGTAVPAVIVAIDNQA